MQYRKLTDEARQAVVDDRIRALETQHFDLGLTVQLLKSAVDGGDDTEETARAIEQIERQREVLERGIAALRASPNRPTRRSRAKAS